MLPLPVVVPDELPHAATSTTALMAVHANLNLIRSSLNEDAACPTRPKTDPAR
jgi:hypothetical protein